MGILIENRYSSLNSDKLFNTFINVNYLDILEDINKQYSNLNNLEQLRKLYQSKIIENSKIKVKIIREQEKIDNQIRLLLDEKNEIYSMKLEKESQLRLKKMNIELNKLFIAQEKNDFAIIQANSIFQKSILLEKKYLEDINNIKRQINEIKKSVFNEHTKIDWNQIKNEKNCFKLNDFCYVKNEILRNRIFETFSLNFELEKNLTQYIKKYSFKLIETTEIKDFSKDFEIITTVTKVVNRIYDLTKDISLSNNTNHLSILVSLKEIINKTSCMLTNDKKDMLNNNGLVKLKNDIEISKNKVLVHNKLTFLFKKKNENDLSTYVQTDNIINILEEHYIKVKTI